MYARLAKRLRAALPGLCAALASLGFLAVASLPALAAEVIHTFDSEITVDENGTLLVTERIRVRAEGRQIRRGIFRDFPTIRRDEYGFVRTQSFELLAAERNGKPEPHRIESVQGGKRVYLGSENVFLPTGDHSYVLRYRTRRQIGHLPDEDEVYWNVTGNAWAFPIRAASATLVLPDGARIQRQASYTGRFGATGSDAVVAEQSARRIVWRTTGPLAQKEGLTVAAAFQKGIVPEPGAPARVWRFFIDNAGLWILLAGVPGIALLYWRRWLAVGRDPPRRIVIPLFSPPQGLSPAAISYIRYRGLGATLGGAPRAFIAALMSLGVKGRIAMSEADGTLTLTKASTASAQSLPAGERALEAGLFASSGTVTVGKENASTLVRTMAAFAAAVNKEHQGRYFHFHLGSVFLFVLLSVALAGLFLTLFPLTDTALGWVIFGSMMIAFGSTFLFTGIRMLSGAIPDASRIWGSIVSLIGAAMVLPALAGILGSSGLLGSLGEDLGGRFVTTLVLIAIAALILINTGFGSVMFSPTEQGQQLMAEIEGFRLYLSVAEADRMNMAGRPDFTVDLFERYLPYAIALGVEKPWSEALEQHLAKAGRGEQASWRPAFHSGHAWSNAAAAASAAAIASTLGSSFASAMPRSSGSGGGGSSGGGGGGGGGGGW